MGAVPNLDRERRDWYGDGAKVFDRLSGESDGADDAEHYESGKAAGYDVFGRGYGGAGETEDEHCGGAEWADPRLYGDARDARSSGAVAVYAYGGWGCGVAPEDVAQVAELEEDGGGGAVFHEV